ncbi:MAG: RNA polymerase sporulation sigma factor SigK [Bacillota bacterium]
MKKIRLVLYRIYLRLFGKRNLLLYICGTNQLPQPLEKGEEEGLLWLAKSGDKNARDLLVSHNLRLVVYIAKKFENTKENPEDLISVGTIGLIKGVKSFNIEKNIKLATYCSRCIENEILMYLRKTSKYKGEISLEEPLNVDTEGNELLLADILGSDRAVVSDEVEDKAQFEQLEGMMKKLSERERYIIEMRFGLFGREEKTQKEVADTLGISQSYISRLEKKIIAKLQKQVNK